MIISPVHLMVTSLVKTLGVKRQIGLTRKGGWQELQFTSPTASPGTVDSRGAGHAELKQSSIPSFCARHAQGSRAQKGALALCPGRGGATFPCMGKRWPQEEDEWVKLFPAVPSIVQGEQTVGESAWGCAERAAWAGVQG